MEKATVDLILVLSAMCVNVIGIGAVVWHQHREFNANRKAVDGVQAECKAMASRLDCFEKAQHACQLDNATTFATKEDMGHIWERVDENTKDIAEVKGRLVANSGSLK